MLPMVEANARSELIACRYAPVNSKMHLNKRNLERKAETLRQAGRRSTWRNYTSLITFLRNYIFKQLHFFKQKRWSLSDSARAWQRWPKNRSDLLECRKFDSATPNKFGKILVRDCRSAWNSWNRDNRMQTTFLQGRSDKTENYTLNDRTTRIHLVALLIGFRWIALWKFAAWS